MLEIIGNFNDTYGDETIFCDELSIDSKSHATFHPKNIRKILGEGYEEFYPGGFGPEYSNYHRLPIQNIRLVRACSEDKVTFAKRYRREGDRSFFQDSTKWRKFNDRMNWFGADIIEQPEMKLYSIELDETSMKFTVCFRKLRNWYEYRCGKMDCDENIEDYFVMSAIQFRTSAFDHEYKIIKNPKIRQWLDEFHFNNKAKLDDFIELNRSRIHSFESSSTDIHIFKECKKRMLKNFHEWEDVLVESVRSSSLEDNNWIIQDEHLFNTIYNTFLDLYSYFYRTIRISSAVLSAGHSYDFY